MQFTDPHQQTWKPIRQIDAPIPGSICALVIDGKATQRKAWFPDRTLPSCHTETAPIDTDMEMPF